LSEVSYYILLSKDLKLAETFDLSEKVVEIGRMLNSYIKTIKSKNAEGLPTTNY
jgi:hypothetical protein